MEQLRKAIERQGVGIGRDVVKVDMFLNHRIDTALLFAMGEAWAEEFRAEKPDLVLTVEASGIAMAVAAAHALGDLPVVFAKKSATVVQNSDTVQAPVYSFTHKTRNIIRIDRKYLPAGSRVLIKDHAGTVIESYENLPPTPGDTVVLMLTPFVVIFTVIFRKFARRAYRHTKNANTEVNTFLSENLSGMKIIQSFNCQERKNEEFKERNRDLYKARREQIFVFSIFRPMVRMLFQGSLLILFFVASMGKIDQASVAGIAVDGAAVVSFYMYIFRFFSPIQNLAEQSFGFRLSPQTAAVLGEHIGNDLSRIYTEFQKLQVVLPEGGEITPDVVEKHIGISKEYNIFELQEALGTRNLPKAYNIMLNFAEHQKENPNIKTILMLHTFFNKMIRYHLAPDKSNDALRDIFGTASPMMISRNMGYANKYSLPQLTRIVSILREYDVKAKGVDFDGDQGELLKEMIYKVTHV